MEYVIYIGLWLLIIVVTIFWAVVNAPLVDDDYNIIEQSKWQKWKQKLGNLKRK